MKSVKYTLSALLLGSIFLSTPVFSSTAPADAAPAEPVTTPIMAVEPTDEEMEATRQKAIAARKEVVARVEGVDITMYDLVGMMNRVAQAYYPHVESPTDDITLEVKRIALNRLIFEELAVKQAIREGIKPPPEKLEQVLASLKDAYGSAEGYQGYLDGLGITEEQLKQRIQRSQLLEGITGREVYQKQIVKQDALDKLYKEYKDAGKLRRPDDFVIKEILVMAAEDEQKTKERADRLLAELKKANNDFGKLVLDGTFIVRKSRIYEHKYPAIFAEIKKMEAGQFSGVVEDGGTFHIFEVLKKELARDHTEEEARGMLEDKLAVYFQEQRRAEWIEELRKDAKVEILLEELKEDVKHEPIAEDNGAGEEE